MLSEDEMDDLHHRCDCYVSFSHSEGVGMGAVEAAMRNKPVIITNYGGAPEYIKTPYTIDCELQELENDDFSQKGMKWVTQIRHSGVMKHAYDNRVRYMDHEHTKQLVGRENVLKEFILNVIGSKDNETDKDSSTHD